MFIKGFDKQLLGVKKNQEKEVEVILPENYPKKEFAKQKANFKCKILNVKKPEPIKIDDNFAKNQNAGFYVRIDSFSDSSIDMLVQTFTVTNDWAEFLKIKECSFVFETFFKLQIKPQGLTGP